ncbi:MAG TPA: redoxin domain-containing protein [Gammaproteobacteria bacterium]|nr:redoxin domain-containing protein [Gammaproteobacteria bacterium]
MLGYGDKAPDFRLPGHPEGVDLARLRGRGKVIVVFFAEADTPLCSRELKPFVADYPDIREMGGSVVAVSADGVPALKQFARALEAPFPLASDARLEVAREYGVAAEREAQARRAVFVLDRDGRVLHANPDYVPGNPSEYEAAVMALDAV